MDSSGDQSEESLKAAAATERANGPGIAEPGLESYAAETGQASLLGEPGNSSWREDVSERLHRYRARRRPRSPRYPSLRLKFEASDGPWTSSAGSSELGGSTTPQISVQGLASRQSLALECEEIASIPEIAEAPAAGVETRTVEVAAHRSEPTAKIIEFPHSTYAPPVRLNELADPVMERPRILEAPEMVPPPPALGGITIEEDAKAEPERRLGIDMPLRPAALAQRMLAVAVDAGIVLLAGVAFSAIFCRLSHVKPPLPQILELGCGLLGAFWAAYQYLLIVYSGSTPGLRFMKLQLQRFDGTRASRRLRRWRVLGSMLSGISLGMGYAWQFLDEDGLCWHERVTKTYLAPQTGAEPSAKNPTKKEIGQIGAFVR